MAVGMVLHRMAIIASDVKNGKLRANAMDDPCDDDRITGTWQNANKLAYGKLTVHSIKFDRREHEVVVDCTIGNEIASFFGFYYDWPDERYYLVLQKAENNLQEYYMFVSLNRSGDEASEYLTTDLTGSIRYTKA